MWENPSTNNKVIMLVAFDSLLSMMYILKEKNLVLV